MPHVIVKDVTRVLHYGEESVSVSMEEVAATDWLEEVYKPDIEARPDRLYKKLGYGPKDL